MYIKPPVYPAEKGAKKVKTQGVTSFNSSYYYFTFISVRGCSFKVNVTFPKSEAEDNKKDGA